MSHCGCFILMIVKGKRIISRREWATTSYTRQVWTTALEQKASTDKTTVCTDWGEHQPWWVPTNGWYQLEKDNINKVSNMFSLEQKESDWKDLNSNVCINWGEHQPWWVPTTGWYQLDKVNTRKKSVFTWTDSIRLTEPVATYLSSEY